MDIFGGAAQRSPAARQREKLFITGIESADYWDSITSDKNLIYYILLETLY